MHHNLRDDRMLTPSPVTTETIHRNLRRLGWGDRQEVLEDERGNRLLLHHQDGNTLLEDSNTLLLHHQQMAIKVQHEGEPYPEGGSDGDDGVGDRSARGCVPCLASPRAPQAPMNKSPRFP